MSQSIHRLVIAILIIITSSLSAQTESSEKLTLDSLNELREQTLSDSELTDELREQIL